MPWVRIDDKAMDHPKLVRLSGDAFKLWVQGLAHCQKFLTDGVIDRTTVRALKSYSPKRCNELLAARLWIAVTDGGVQVHDFLQWNESRDEVLRARSVGKDRQRRFRSRNGVTEGVRNGVTNALVTPRDKRVTNAFVTSGVVRTHPDLQVQQDGGERGGVGEREGDSTPQLRAGAFCEFYAAAHQRFLGVGYLGNPQNDYQAALRLIATFTDAELRDAVLVWLGMDDDFAAKGTRSIPKFASRASQCVLLAKGVAR